MSDVTAVILTVGEASTQRAIDSVQCQSLKPYEVITIENVSPFYKAMNQAIEKVTSDFFVQVDADMILDKDCFAILRKYMAPQVGIVVGNLRDPLVQSVTGVKMYRKACFQTIRFTDSVSPDTDVKEALDALGWNAIRALHFSDHDKHLSQTVGDHRPLYTHQYTYSKYLLEGKRYRYRRNRGALKSRLERLQQSHEHVAPIAQIALSHGFFQDIMGDELTFPLPAQGWDDIEELFNSTGRYRLPSFAITFLPFFSRPHKFKRFYQLGIAIRQAQAGDALKQVMNNLKRWPIQISWIPLVALCHGVFSTEFINSDYTRAENALSEFAVHRGNRHVRKTLRSRLKGVLSKFLYFLTE